MRTHSEYSVGASGPFRRGTPDIAVGVARSEQKRVHLYRVDDGARKFIGYAMPDGRVVPA